MLDCSTLEGQIMVAVGVAVVTLVLEALIGHLALKKRIPSASILGLFFIAGAMLFLWLHQKTKKEKPE